MPHFGKALFSVIALASGSLGAGCAGPPPCSSSALCPEGTVCAATGACVPLDPAPGRFARAEWVGAQDWAETGGERIAGDTDLLLVGGDEDKVTFLRFGPLPEAGRVERAILVMWPHATWVPPEFEARVGVHRAGHLDSGRRAPRVSRAPLSETGIAAGATRPLRFDVTEAVKEALASAVGEVSLAIEATGAGSSPLRFASPRALEARRRPRLELTVR